MAMGEGAVFARSGTGHSFHYHHLNNTDTEKRQLTGNYPFNHQYPATDIEKRQLFLRSYRFSRKKKSVGERIKGSFFGERIKGSFFRVKRVIWVRFRHARRIRRMVWSRIKLALLLCCVRKRRFLRLHCQNNKDNRSWSSSCLW